MRKVRARVCERARRCMCVSVRVFFLFSLFLLLFTYIYVLFFRFYYINGILVKVKQVSGSCVLPELTVTDRLPPCMVGTDPVDKPAL